MSRPIRQRLPHNPPEWVAPEAKIFVTVCAKKRRTNTLCVPGLAEEIADSVAFRVQRVQWDVPLFLLMPDHLHMIARFNAEVGVQKVMTDWKRFTARQLGVEWQRDFFEHRLRGPDEVERKAEYIRQNPARTGLTECAEDWPYVWSFARER